MATLIGKKVSVETVKNLLFVPNSVAIVPAPVDRHFAPPLKAILRQIEGSKNWRVSATNRTVNKAMQKAAIREHLKMIGYAEHSWERDENGNPVCVAFKMAVAV